MTAVLGTAIAVSACAVEVTEDFSVDEQTGALRTSGGGRKSPAAIAVALQGDAFRIEQIDFVDGGGLSAWGALTVDPILVARQTGVEAGFVSVRTELGWVVHNLPVQSRPEHDWPDRVVRQGLRAPTVVPPVRTYFDIGSESPLRAVSMVVIFTSAPLGSSRDLRKWERASLVPTQVTTTQQTQPSGIATPRPGGLPPGPPPPPPVLAPEPIDAELGVQNWYTVTLPSEENVNAALNQCAPAAYANALAYLRGTFGLDVPNPNVRGVNGGPSLVGILDLLSQRPVTDTCTGSPVAYCFSDDNLGGMLNGLYSYLATTGLDEAVTLEHQGFAEDFPAACANSIPQQAPVSTASGTAVTVPWIRNHIENGDAVVLAFNRLADTPNGEVVTSGHMVRIYGYSEVSGQAFLWALDDQQQDGLNNNVCVPQDDGLTLETWAVGDSDNDGTLNKGLVKLREITFAMAIGVN